MIHARRPRQVTHTHIIGPNVGPTDTPDDVMLVYSGVSNSLSGSGANVKLIWQRGTGQYEDYSHANHHDYYLP